MGSAIKINDTLKISKERGFPQDLILDKHLKNPQASNSFINQTFSFWNSGERLYHRPPTRVWLVEEIKEKWLYWGHALITEQTLRDGKTEGKYKIIKIYPPEYQQLVTIHEAPEGKSYFYNNN